MYLIERLTGVMVYSIVLFIVVYYIYKTRRLGKILGIYAIVLALMAFVYEPSVTADLYRIYDAMRYFSQMPWDMFQNELLSTATPAYLIYIRLIGSIGIQELLPAITAYIYYINIFYVIKRSALKYKVSNKSVALALFFLMSFGQFIQVISGIRSMLAFSIVVRCMYEEVIENKNPVINLWKYICAFLLHPVGVVACVIRIFYEIFCFKAKNYTQLMIKIVFIICIFLVGIFIALPYIENMLFAAQEYITNDGYSYIWEYCMSGIYLALMAYSLYKYKNYLKENKTIQSLVKLLKILICVICMLFFEYTIFQRFTVFISMLFIPIYIYILRLVEKNFLKNERYIKIMFYIPLMVLLLACLRGNLSAYKFFVL